MSTEHSTLPPLLHDAIQGRLDFIILRPILIPPLLPHHGIRFRYNWWGSNYIHDKWLPPGCEELKTVFNICCDYKGLQKYLEDIKIFEIKLYIAPEKSVNEEQSYNSGELLSHSKPQLRKIKEWKVGDYIGKILLPNLKLNARGEYVNEFNILNIYGDQLGSIVIFMLFTSKGLEGSSLREEYSLQEKNIESYNVTNSLKCIDQKAVKQFSLGVKQTSYHNKFARDNITEKHQIDSLNCDDSKTKFTSSHEVELCESSINKNLTLSQIFSFVDSGAIQPSDLPTLVQISQGRSPSIEKQAFNYEGNLSFPRINSEEDLGQHIDYNKCHRSIKSSLVECAQVEQVNFLKSGLKKLNENYDVNNSGEVYSEEFKNEHEPERLIEYKASPLPDEFEDYNTRKSENDCGVLILNFHSMKFGNEQDVLHSKLRNHKNNIERIVHQRSQICYFIEVSLEYEEIEDNQSALFLSRRLIGNEEVIFDFKKMFFLRGKQYENHNGYMRFIIFLRRLGKCSRKEVGTANISLAHLMNYGNKKPILLPIKISNSSNSLSEIPFIILHFSIIMAPVRSKNACHTESLFNPSINYRNEDINVKDIKISECSNSVSEKVNYLENCDGKEIYQEVHLEILEANDLPVLWSKNKNKAFAPSTYVTTNIKEICETSIMKNSSSPKWNFTHDFKLKHETLKSTNFLLIMKVFHSIEGNSVDKEDLMLGFATIDTSILWKSIVSLCGWIPVLTIEGDVCGELKVSLTSKRSTWRSKLAMKEVEADAELVPEVSYYCDYDQCSKLENKSEKDLKQNQSNLFTETHSLNFSEESSISNHSPHNLYDCSRLDFESPEIDKVQTKTSDEGGKYYLDVQKSQKGSSPINHIIEGLQWMNHISSSDSPCVSYLDLSPDETNKKPVTQTRPFSLKTLHDKTRKKKLRIAANLKFI